MERGVRGAPCETLSHSPRTDTRFTRFTHLRRRIEMRDFIHSFIEDEHGLTMVEYAIAGALIVAVGTTVFATLGTAVSTRISVLATDVTPAA
jgi:pilus assembly protein Flp/PilA